MPTYREDLHLGHKVSLIESDDIANKAVTPEKLSDEAVMFSHLSLDALEGIKAWLEGHPPVPVTGVFDSTFDATFA